MAAAAVSSLVRRSSRLTSRRSKPDHIDNDDSSSDPENELTPRALRALKRQRLALDLVPLRTRSKRRRKENLPQVGPLHLSSSITKRPFQCPTPIPDSIKHPPELALPLSPDPTPSPDTSPEPLTPLTPLSPSPESSPSLPGHDRQPLPPSPPHDTLPPPPSPEPTPPSTDHVTPPPPLDPSLDTLIPFDGLHPHFHHDLSVQIPPQPPPQLQALELQDQFHSFPQPQLYVPPPVFVRDREINIWKLACQERVDCLSVPIPSLRDPILTPV